MLILIGVLGITLILILVAAFLLYRVCRAKKKRKLLANEKKSKSEILYKLPSVEASTEHTVQDP